HGRRDRTQPGRRQDGGLDRRPRSRGRGRGRRDRRRGFARGDRGASRLAHGSLPRRGARLTPPGAGAGVAAGVTARWPAAGTVALLGLRPLMPHAKRWKLSLLAFVLAVVAAGCAEPPAPQVSLGSGVRFLPQVADSLGDVGRYPSLVTGSDGLPVVAYFG